MIEKSKGLTLEEAIRRHKHEKRRFRRAKEDHWHEMHEDKIIRCPVGSGQCQSSSSVRALRLEDALAKDWELEAIYRSLSADEIAEAMLDVIRRHEHVQKSPMELLKEALYELGLL